MSYYGYSHKSTEMNDWIRLSCKEPQEGLLVTDIDFLFYDFKLKRMKILEVKTFNKKIKDWQAKLYKTLDFALMNMTELDNIGGFEYEGFFVLTLDTTSPETAKTINLNGVDITKEQLIYFLDFKIRFCDLNGSQPSPSGMANGGALEA